MQIYESDEFLQSKKRTKILETEEDDVTYVNLYPASASVLEVRVFPSAPFVLGDARALLYSHYGRPAGLPFD